MIPIRPIAREGSFTRKERIIKLNPIAEITSSSNSLKCISNHRANETNVNSRNTSHKPLVSRNRLLTDILFCRLKEIKAETPERNTNAGAQICVTHLVKNSNVVVVCRSKGF
jgi:hypothetical protein